MNDRSFRAACQCLILACLLYSPSWLPWWLTLLGVAS